MTSGPSISHMGSCIHAVLLGKCGFGCCSIQTDVGSSYVPCPRGGGGGVARSGKASVWGRDLLGVLAQDACRKEVMKHPRKSPICFQSVGIMSSAQHHECALHLQCTTFASTSIGNPAWCLRALQMDCQQGIWVLMPASRSLSF